ANQTPPVVHAGITSGHILLGVLKERTCAGGLVLGKLSLDFEFAIAQTEWMLQYGRRRDSQEPPTMDWEGIPHTATAKKVLDLCIEEANVFSPTYPIGTEHLLLSLLRVDGVGCRLLNY